ncbi:MAG: response regulator [Bacilli bacterium]|nr:response regulator [Bacilli bacterium]
MHPSIPLLILSLIYTILILSLFITKDKVDTIENKVYNYLLITVIVGILLDIAGIYCHLYLPDTSFIRWLVVKFYLAYLLLFIYLITIYLIILSDKAEMDSIKGLNKKSKSVKIIKFITGILIVSIILNFVLKFTYYKEGNSVYLFGENTIFVYALAGLGILSWLFIVIKNRKNIPIKKVVPILIFIFICIPVILLQLSNPEILVVTSLTAFLVNFMFHTIENPDTKLIEELNENRVLIEKTNEEKSNFLFKLTGEIKNPVSYIYHVSEDLLGENDITKLQKGINVIHSSSRRLSYIINDITDVTGLDNKKIKVINSVYNIYNIIDEIKVRLNKEKKDNIEFRYNIDNNLPESLYGDVIKLKQVIMTFLNNSLKYTKKGFIEFNIDSIIKYDVCRLIITIEDSGIGMNISKVNDLLKSDEELSDDDVSKLGTIDLDIKLAKKVIKHLGGSIMIKSEEEKGTEIIIVLDQKIKDVEKSNASMKYENASFRNKRVLVVNDNIEELNVIENIFKEQNANVTTTMYGKDCIDKISSKEKFDLIIVDDEMPNLSGLDTLKELKTIKGFNTPVVIMLSKVKEGIKHHYIEDGFKDYLLKENIKSETSRIAKKFI